MFNRVFKRAYATRWPRPKPRTSERPPWRAQDPLLASQAATQLTDADLTFIHRPPPTQQTPHSLTTHPVSPLLRPPATTTVSSTLPPLSRPPPKTSEHTPKQLSSSAINKIRTLRFSDPARFTRGRLAHMFNCTQNFVGLVAALPSATRKHRLNVREADHARNRNKWSQRHTTVVDMRNRRREFW